MNSLDKVYKFWSYNYLGVEGNVFQCYIYN